MTSELMRRWTEQMLADCVRGLSIQLAPCVSIKTCTRAATTGVNIPFTDSDDDAPADLLAWGKIDGYPFYPASLGNGLALVRGGLHGTFREFLNSAEAVGVFPRLANHIDHCVLTDDDAHVSLRGSQWFDGMTGLRYVRFEIIVKYAVDRAK